MLPRDMECDTQNFFLILDGFLPFYPTNNTDSQNFQKVKKTPGDIITLNMCTINDNHIMYFPEIRNTRDNFLSF